MSEASCERWPVVVLRGDALQLLAISELDIANLTHELITETHGEALPLVEHLIVADYSEYRDAILAATAGATQTAPTSREEYKGIAMTIPNATQDGMTNTVVVCAGIVAAALGHDNVVPTMPPAIGRYLLQHEFAHCYDHCVRGLPSRVSNSNSSWLQRANESSKQQLMAEFAACHISGATLTDEALELLSHLDTVPLEAELQRILRFREEYRTRHSIDIAVLAGEACQCTWLVLVQYAKLTGHMIGAARTSASIRVPDVLAARPQAMAVVNELAQLLSTTISDYPNWPDAGWPELEALWSRLAVALGFRFEETPQGPALWLD